MPGHDSCQKFCNDFKNEFEYGLSNSNNSKCNKLRYDEKWDVQKLKIFGNSQGYFGHFDDLYDIVFCRKQVKGARRRRINKCTSYPKTSISSGEYMSKNTWLSR